jgi:hypothetical protein
MGKILLLLLLGLTVLSCGRRETFTIINGIDGKDGLSCSVSDYTIEEQVLGALLSCTDGSSSILLNKVGAIGAIGAAGANGLSCSVVRIIPNTYITVSCPDTPNVIVYDGTNGTDGALGGCTLAGPNKNKYTITCGNNSVTFTSVGGSN